MSYEQQLEQIRADAETWPDWKRREVGLPPKTAKPSDLFTQMIRAESSHCQTTAGASMLQAVAAWLEGRDIFDPHAELWEHADRLCGGDPNVAVKTCETCGGAIVSISETAKLCSCNLFVEGKLEDLAVVYDFRMPPKETITATPPSSEP